MLVPNIVKELDLVARRKEGSRIGVYKCIAPTLCGIKHVKEYSDHEMGQTKANLVIKASLLIQIFKERSMRRPTPTFHIRNFEIASDCQ